MTATNPESGLTTYTYDANGNLDTKTDARNWKTTFAYDTLNRPTSKSYSNASTPPASTVTAPSVTWAWDSTTNGKGQLASIASGSTTVQFSSYDSLGRVLASTQTTSGTAYSFGYTYNLAGGLEMETYPSTRAVTTCYDQVGRIKAVSGKATPAATSSTNYTGTGAITYAPHGGMLSMIRGDSLTEAWAYNNRLQPTSISVAKTTINAFGASLFYCPNKTATCTTNNGNLLAQSITIPDVDQNFAYDHLNRISSAAEGAEGANWSRNYGYDAYSNRWVVYPSPGVGIDSFTPIGASNFDTKNRLQIQNSDYDPAGNQTQIGGYAFVSDAESRLVNSTQLNVTTTYGYDGQGRRVTKQVGAGSPTKYVYDAMGKLAAEYGGTPMLCVTCYFAVDHLGSTRAVTDGAGGVVERHDYLPFGEEIYAGVGGRTDVSTTMKFLNPNEADTLTQKFTGQTRDAESRLDYMGARYFSGPQGRFTSPDEPFADQNEGDPQSWNLYSYVRNNPFSGIDPSGRCSTAPGGYVDAGSELFDGPCRSGIIGDDKDKKPDITVVENSGGSSWAYGYMGQYLQGSFSPPSPQQMAIHDPLPGMIVDVQSVLGDAQMAIAVGNLGKLGLKAGLRTVKPINLPSWRTVKIDILHVLDRHTTGGAGAGATKTLFPSGMSETQIETAIREAYRFGENVGSQGDRILIQGQSGGLKIEMYVNKATRTIETAYPKF